MKIRIISMRTIIEEAFLPHIVHDYCSRCENFNLHFSCPSHQFNIPAFINQYSFALIISHKIAAQYDEYYYWRDLIDPTLLKYEKIMRGQALLAGSCRNCDFCFDKGAEKCTSPSLLRYSFESLGFDVAAILEEFFNERLSFDMGTLHLVYGILLKEKPDPIDLNELEGELSGLSS